MKIYLAGPMRGYPKLNFPAFHAAAAKLRAQGFEVFSPAEKGEEILAITDPAKQHDLDFRRLVFSIDTGYICKNADAVALLPGWEQSAGARCERAVAEAIGLTVIILGTEYQNVTANQKLALLS